MSDSIGGTYIVGIIVMFIIIASGYMAFNVNYTKAFRMKDKLVTVYERNNGTCNSSCMEEIIEYAKEIGYTGVTNLNCPTSEGYEKGPNGYPYALYCIKKTVSYEGKRYGKGEASIVDGEVIDRRNICYYSFITKINISIPVIDKLFNLEVFQITGDTKSMTGCD